MIRISLIFMALLTPAWANAQVVVNQAALTQLAGIQPPPVETMPPRPPAPMLHHTYKRLAAKPLQASVKPPAAPKPAISPLVPVVAKPAAPAAPKLAPVAPVTLVFTSASADMPANTAASLQPVCAGAGVAGIISVDAYAAADGTDISAPLRLSLRRAFAIRDALTACGVPAAHIIARADGAVAGHDPDKALIDLNAGAPSP